MTANCTALMSSMGWIMPIGTPGMPGPKQGEWDLYQFRDGEATPFMTL